MKPFSTLTRSPVRSRIVLGLIPSAIALLLSACGGGGGANTPDESAASRSSVAAGKRTAASGLAPVVSMKAVSGERAANQIVIERLAGASTFNVVKAQMSLEVRYLTNALQFLSTGSTNLKDVIASGNASAGLALSAAAANIQGSAFVNENSIPPKTSVSFSWQSLLNVVGSVASTAANAAGVGALTPAWNDLSQTLKNAITRGTGIANTIGSAVSIASNGSTLLHHSTRQALPAPFTQFTTTIGELANNALQGQMVIGFDVMSDNITSDWGRLSTIGPMVVAIRATRCSTHPTRSGRT